MCVSCSFFVLLPCSFHFVCFYFQVWTSEKTPGVCKNYCTGTRCQRRCVAKKKTWVAKTFVKEVTHCTSEGSGRFFITTCKRGSKTWVSEKHEAECVKKCRGDTCWHECKYNGKTWTVKRWKRNVQRCWNKEEGEVLVRYCRKGSKTWVYEKTRGVCETSCKGGWCERRCTAKGHTWLVKRFLQEKTICTDKGTGRLYIVTCTKGAKTWISGKHTAQCWKECDGDSCVHQCKYKEHKWVVKRWKKESQRCWNKGVGEELIRYCRKGDKEWIYSRKKGKCVSKCSLGQCELRCKAGDETWVARKWKRIQTKCWGQASGRNWVRFCRRGTKTWIAEKKEAECWKKCVKTECFHKCKYAGKTWTVKRWKRDLKRCWNKGVGEFLIRYCRKGEKTWVYSKKPATCETSCTGNKCERWCEEDGVKWRAKQWTRVTQKCESRGSGRFWVTVCQRGMKTWISEKKPAECWKECKGIACLHKCRHEKTTWIIKRWTRNARRCWDKGVKEMLVRYCRQGDRTWVNQRTRGVCQTECKGTACVRTCTAKAVKWTVRKWTRVIPKCSWKGSGHYYIQTCQQGEKTWVADRRKANCFKTCEGSTCYHKCEFNKVTWVVKKWTQHVVRCWNNGVGEELIRYCRKDKRVWAYRKTPGQCYSQCKGDLCTRTCTADGTTWIAKRWRHVPTECSWKGTGRFYVKSCTKAGKTWEADKRDARCWKECADGFCTHKCKYKDATWTVKRWKHEAVRCWDKGIKDKLVRFCRKGDREWVFSRTTAECRNVCDGQNCERQCKLKNKEWVARKWVRKLTKCWWKAKGEHYIRYCKKGFKTWESQRERAQCRTSCVDALCSFKCKYGAKEWIVRTWRKEAIRCYHKGVGEKWVKYCQKGKKVWVHSRKAGECRNRCHERNCERVCEAGGRTWVVRRWTRDIQKCYWKGSGRFYVKVCRKGHKTWESDKKEARCKKACRGDMCFHTCAFGEKSWTVKSWRREPIRCWNKSAGEEMVRFCRKGARVWEYARTRGVCQNICQGVVCKRSCTAKNVTWVVRSWTRSLVKCWWKGVGEHYVKYCQKGSRVWKSHQRQAECNTKCASGTCKLLCTYSGKNWVARTWAEEKIRYWNKEVGEQLVRMCQKGSRQWQQSKARGNCQQKCEGDSCRRVCELRGRRWTVRRWKRNITRCYTRGTGQYYIKYCKRGSREWIPERHHAEKCRKMCHSKQCEHTCLWKHHKWTVRRWKRNVDRCWYQGFGKKLFYVCRAGTRIWNDATYKPERCWKSCRRSVCSLMCQAKGTKWAAKNWLRHRECVHKGCDKYAQKRSCRRVGRSFCAKFETKFRCARRGSCWKWKCRKQKVEKYCARWYRYHQKYCQASRREPGCTQFCRRCMRWGRVWKEPKWTNVRWATYYTGVQVCSRQRGVHMGTNWKWFGNPRNCRCRYSSWHHCRWHRWGQCRRLQCRYRCGGYRNRGRTICRRARGRGDPHLRTLDGHQYVANKVGDFRLLKCESAGTGFEVQARITQMGKQGTVITGLAVKTLSMHGAFQVYANPTYTYKLSGSDAKKVLGACKTPESMAEGHLRIKWRNDGKELFVETNNGLEVSLGVEFIEKFGRRVLSMDVLPKSTYKGHCTGLLGNFNEVKNDYSVEKRLHSGKGGLLMEGKDSLFEVPHEFQKTWKAPTEKEMAEHKKKMAAALKKCRDMLPNTVKPGSHLFRDCAFDIVATGSTSFVTADFNAFKQAQFDDEKEAHVKKMRTWSASSGGPHKPAEEKDSAVGDEDSEARTKSKCKVQKICVRKVCAQKKWVPDKKVRCWYRIRGRAYVKYCRRGRGRTWIDVRHKAECHPLCIDKWCSLQCTYALKSWYPKRWRANHTVCRKKGVEKELVETCRRNTRTWVRKRFPAEKCERKCQYHYCRDFCQYKDTKWLVKRIKAEKCFSKGSGRFYVRFCKLGKRVWVSHRRRGRCQKRCVKDKCSHTCRYRRKRWTVSNWTRKPDRCWYQGFGDVLFYMCRHGTRSWVQTRTKPTKCWDECKDKVCNRMCQALDQKWIARKWTRGRSVRKCWWRPVGEKYIQYCRSGRRGRAWIAHRLNGECWTSCGSRWCRVRCSYGPKKWKAHRFRANHTVCVKKGVNNKFVETCTRNAKTWTAKTVDADKCWDKCEGSRCFNYCKYGKVQWTVRTWKPGKCWWNGNGRFYVQTCKSGNKVWVAQRKKALCWKKCEKEKCVHHCRFNNITWEVKRWVRKAERCWWNGQGETAYHVCRSGGSSWISKTVKASKCWNACENKTCNRFCQVGLHTWVARRWIIGQSIGKCWWKGVGRKYVRYCRKGTRTWVARSVEANCWTVCGSKWCTVRCAHGGTKWTPSRYRSNTTTCRKQGKGDALVQVCRRNNRTWDKHRWKAEKCFNECKGERCTRYCSVGSNKWPIAKFVSERCWWANSKDFRAKYCTSRGYTWIARRNRGHCATKCTRKYGGSCTRTCEFQKHKWVARAWERKIKLPAKSFDFRHYRFYRIPVRGNMNSKNILDACLQRNLRPVCDHASYTDGQCQLVGEGWHFSYPPHTTARHIAPWRMRGVYMYAGRANGGKSLENIGTTHRWSSGRDRNGDTLCVKARDTHHAFDFRGFRFFPVKVSGAINSANIYKSCKAHGLRPACDHSTYTDGKCVVVSGTWHLSYPAHTRKQSGLADHRKSLKGAYFYCGGVKGGKALMNTGATHRWTYVWDRGFTYCVRRSTKGLSKFTFKYDGFTAKRVAVKGPMNSPNIRKACANKGMKPMCDHSSYRDGHCVLVGENWHFRCVFFRGAYGLSFISLVFRFSVVSA